MANISKKYPYFSEDEYGKWKHYNAFTKALVEPSQKYIDEHPETIEEEPVDRVVALENQVRILEGETMALKESNNFYEECLVEMAEIVYA